MRAIHVAGKVYPHVGEVGAELRRDGLGRPLLIRYASEDAQDWF